MAEAKTVKKSGSADNSKYVVYAAGYTRDHKHGIWLYDYHPETGRISFKAQTEISNPSYISISHGGSFLYSITDSNGLPLFIGNVNQL